jgi:hypothetical protein
LEYIIFPVNPECRRTKPVKRSPKSLMVDSQFNERQNRVALKLFRYMINCATNRNVPTREAERPNAKLPLPVESSNRAVFTCVVN